MSLFSARGLLACALVLALPLARASGDVPESGAPLTLQEAVTRTLQSTPDLKACGYELRAQEGLIRQAGTALNPELAVDVEDVLGTGSRRGAHDAQTTLSLRQVFEGGALSRRIAAATAGRELLDAELSEKRLDASAAGISRLISLSAIRPSMYLSGSSTKS